MEELYTIRPGFQLPWAPRRVEGVLPERRAEDQPAHAGAATIACRTSVISIFPVEDKTTGRLSRPRRPS